MTRGGRADCEPAESCRFLWVRVVGPRFEAETADGRVGLASGHQPGARRLCIRVRRARRPYADPVLAGATRRLGIRGRRPSLTAPFLHGQAVCHRSQSRGDEADAELVGTAHRQPQRGAAVCVRDDASPRDCDSRPCERPALAPRRACCQERDGGAVTGTQSARVNPQGRPGPRRRPDRVTLERRLCLRQPRAGVVGPDVGEAGRQLALDRTVLPCELSPSRAPGVVSGVRLCDSASLNVGLELCQEPDLVKGRMIARGSVFIGHQWAADLRSGPPPGLAGERGKGTKTLLPSAKLALRGAIAQLGERLVRNQEVAGSSPASSIVRIPTRHAGSGHLRFSALTSPPPLWGTRRVSHPLSRPHCVLGGEVRSVLELVDHVPVRVER